MSPDGLVIRPAVRADYSALVTAFGEPQYFADRIGRSRHNLGVLLVGWIDETPVGSVYLWCEPLEEPELLAEFPGAPLLNHLDVAPDRRNQGIGAALVRACEAAARDRGHEILLLGVGVDNPDARRLYERLGYMDWQRGPIIARWSEPDGTGGVRRAELTVDTLIRSLLAPDLEAWDAWHPSEMATHLAGVTSPWHVAGGWALDLWRETLGKPNLREHGDLEIAIPRHRFPAMAAALADFELFSAGSGEIRPLRDRTVIPTPHHQVWIADMSVPPAGCYRSDMFLEPGDDETWVCRRGEGITRPMADVVRHTAAGIPFLAPECTLIYKAKWSDLPKNELDFAANAPDLDDRARSWLVDALTRAHPGHPWIGRLT